MFKKQPVVRYISYDNTIKFPTKIASNLISDFAAALYLWQQRRPDHLLTLDFLGVQSAYPNGMLAIISSIDLLRSRGVKLKILLPNDAHVRRLFRSTNWAFFLDPEVEKSDYHHNRHLVTRQFRDFRRIPDILNDFMDVVLMSIKMPKDIISGLEWSINEICDNVINHSESEVGGFVQVITYPTKNLIAFTVADAGRGILTTLKEGIPTLRTDSQAIGEAIKAGVTRNKEVGQGNGLAGTLKISTMTGGSLDITSGASRFYSTSNVNKSTDEDSMRSHKGTIVSGQIYTTKNFSIGEALNFGGKAYAPLNIIDQKYEMEDNECLIIKMKEETTGAGTRSAGKQMRVKIINLIDSKPGYPIFIDWDGVPVIASSFADEFIGKLFIELGAMAFSATIRNKNMEQLIQQLLDKAISQRVAQENPS